MNQKQVTLVVLIVLVVVVPPFAGNLMSFTVVERPIPDDSGTLDVLV